MNEQRPEPVEIPDGWVLTSGYNCPDHGEWAPPTHPEFIEDDDWQTISPGGRVSLVWWRPTPRRTVTVELDEGHVRCWAGYDTPLGDACKAALEILDAEDDQ